MPRGIPGQWISKIRQRKEVFKVFLLRFNFVIKIKFYSVVYFFNTAGPSVLFPDVTVKEVIFIKTG